MATTGTTRTMMLRVEGDREEGEDDDDEVSAGGEKRRPGRPRKASLVPSPPPSAQQAQQGQQQLPDGFPDDLPKGFLPPDLLQVGVTSFRGGGDLLQGCGRDQESLLSR